MNGSSLRLRLRFASIHSKKKRKIMFNFEFKIKEHYTLFGILPFRNAATILKTLLKIKSDLIKCFKAEYFRLIIETS